MRKRAMNDARAKALAIRYHEGESLVDIRQEATYRMFHIETLKKYNRYGYYLITGKKPEAYKRDPHIKRYIKDDTTTDSN